MHDVNSTELDVVPISPKLGTKSGGHRIGAKLSREGGVVTIIKHAWRAPVRHGSNLAENIEETLEPAQISGQDRLVPTPGGQQTTATSNLPHQNASPDTVFTTIDDLRLAMTRSNPDGDAFLNYLLEGRYFDGKRIWINKRPSARKFYDELLRTHPHLACESPFGSNFRYDMVRTRGENRVFVRSLRAAPVLHQRIIEAHRRNIAAGNTSPVALFAGGPAAKIAALICTLATSQNGFFDVKFVLDGAEQSNESGSASYEHINHANALNAELDNTGWGILRSALSRACRGEPLPDVALSVEYRKVDLWPRALSWRDIPIFVGNEIHGRVQTLRRVLGYPTHHTKSRLASKKATEILSFLEDKFGCSFRLDKKNKKAVFLYFTVEHFRHSLRDNSELRQTIGLKPISLSAEQLTSIYGPRILKRVVAADLFPENSCIRHGFDEVCGNMMVKLGVEYHHRQRIADIYFDAMGDGSSRVLGVTLEDSQTGRITCVAVDYLGLSLGPTASYHFGESSQLFDKVKDRFRIGLPVPYQTIATGLSAQVLFRITNKARASNLPFTGMKQTHFVEIGRTDSHVLMKLTCGGMIGLPVYSRSYGISALASILRVLTSEIGLEFEDVICAWPCARGVNTSNNGQVVRLADNAVARFGEGGTGMSKMGSNAQTLLDLIGIDWPTPRQIRMSEDLYTHTIVDNRKAISRRLFR